MSKAEVIEELNALASKINRMEQEQKGIYHAFTTHTLAVERDLMAALRQVYAVLERLVETLP